MIFVTPFYCKYIHDAFIDTHAYIHTYIHAYIDTCTHTHTYVHTGLLSSVARTSKAELWAIPEQSRPQGKGTSDENSEWLALPLPLATRPPAP